MDNGTINAGYLLRLVGFFTHAIGIAWAVQTLGFGSETLLAKLMWVIAAASMAGAGAGVIVASSAVDGNSAMSPARA